jgi:hypothetical protein
MNPFWPHLYDDSKDRRYAALFLTSLLTFFGLLILTAVIFALASTFGLQKYFPYALPGIGLLAVAWVCRAVRRARARRRERLQYSPLSRDELRVARSKLVKDQSV